jgi:2,3-dihydroxy-2,3-dihydro-p-cumate dehydrogenase
VADDLAATAVETLGHVDVLVNNAGGGVIRPTLEHTEESLRATVDNNLWTTIYCVRAVLPHMASRGHGRIVNIGADSVRTGLTDHAMYNAAKGGVHAMVTGLAREFAATGITANTVAPCYVRTPELTTLLESGQAPPRLERVVEEGTAIVPIGRPGDPAEVAAAVAFLAGEESRFITGQTIYVNGGSSMG